MLPRICGRNGSGAPNVDNGAAACFGVQHDAYNGPRRTTATSEDGEPR